MSGTGEERRRGDRAQQVALFRYQLIREAADPALSTRQRGRLVCELAARAHPGPFGDPVSVSRATIDRWIRAWRAGGFDALVPPARQVLPRTDAETLELAAALKREKPGRTAAQVGGCCGRTAAGPRRSAPCSATSSAWSSADPARRAAAGDVRPVRGRPAERAVDRRRAARPARGRPQDVPVRLPGRPHQAVMAARWGYFEDTVRLAAALRPALAARGIPESIYVDNG